MGLHTSTFRCAEISPVDAWNPTIRRSSLGTSTGNEHTRLVMEDATPASQNAGLLLTGSDGSVDIAKSH